MAFSLWCTQMRCPWFAPCIRNATAARGKVVFRISPAGLRALGSIGLGSVALGSFGAARCAAARRAVPPSCRQWGCGRAAASPSMHTSCNGNTIPLGDACRYNWKLSSLTPHPESSPQRYSVPSTQSTVSADGSRVDCAWQSPPDKNSNRSVLHTPSGHRH